MKPASPAPTPRLLRAAAAERGDLERHRTALRERRHRVLSELAELEAALAQTDERLMLLDRLTGSAGGEDGTAAAETEANDRSRRTPAHSGRPVDVLGPGAARAAESAASAGRAVLRGPAIRRTAVRLLLEHPHRPEALHYREWYALLTAAGYEVAGKEPLAVFLTQLGRSPVVHRGTQSGVYELDREAGRRLRARLAELQGRVAQLTASSSGPTTDLRSLRTRRTALMLEIGKLERALEEAEEALAHAAPPAARVASAAG